MKTLQLSKLSALLCFAALALAARAQTTVLLTINVGNPGAVTFTATVGNQSAATGSIAQAAGFTLLNFFTSNQNVDDVALTGNLTAGGLSVATAGTILGPTAGVFIGPDLNLFGTTGTYSFTAGSPALAGSSTLDLTGYTLPAIGATGNIQLGDYGNNAPMGAVIGTWQAVPEPSTYALFGGLVVLGVAAVRRHRAASAVPAPAAA